MPDSTLSVLAKLWSVLLQRTDIDSIAKELFGCYSLLTVPSTGNHASDPLFGVACQFKTIFNLQRIHLQSWTPGSGSLDASIAQERIMYLMSFEIVVRVVFFLLNRLSALLDMENTDDSHRSTRYLLVQTILSGTRVLCLHPKKAVVPLELIELLEHCISQKALTWDETNMLRVCHGSSKGVPAREKNLRLGDVESNLYPLDEAYLVKVVKERIQDANKEPLRAYLALYDISWSIVGAAITCRKDGERKSEENACSVASRIWDLFPKALGQRPSDNLISTVFADPFWPLGPLLGQTDKQCPQTVTTPEGILLQERELVSLTHFLGVLTDRQQELRNCDKELRQVLSDVSILSSNSTTQNKNQPTHSPSKFYNVNCLESHTVTEKEAEGLLNGYIAQELKADGICYLRDGEQCPVCKDPVSITCIREIKQLSQINRTVMYVMDNLAKSLKLHGERRFSSLNPKTTHEVSVVAAAQAGTSIVNQDPPLLIKPSLDGLVPHQRCSEEAPGTPGTLSVSDQTRGTSMYSVTLNMAHTSIPYNSTTSLSVSLQKETQENRHRRLPFHRGFLRHFGTKWRISPPNRDRIRENEPQQRPFTGLKGFFRSMSPFRS